MSLTSMVQKLFSGNTKNVDSIKIKKEQPPDSSDVFQSRWGYHPYSYETHLKLKKLHKWVFDSFRKHSKLIRWCAKEEQRPAQEPETDPIFTQRIFTDHSWKSRSFMAQYYKDAETGEIELQSIDKSAIHPETEALLTVHPLAYYIVVDFRESRMPAESPEEVIEPDLTKEAIDTLYGEVFGD